MITGLGKRAFGLLGSWPKNKTKSLESGFTIVETLIVLVVTSGVLVSAFSIINGQQSKTEFSTSVADIRQQIDDVISNVSNGYYTRIGDFRCTTPGSSQPVIDAVTKNRGTNEGCVFVGRALQFSVGGNRTRFNIYSLVGRQYIQGSSTIESTSLDEAIPIALANGNTYTLGIGVTDPTEVHALLYGLNAKTLKYDGINDTGVIAFITDFAHPGITTPQSETASRNVLLYAINGTTLTSTAPSAIDAISTWDPITHKQNFVKASKIELCLEGGTNKHAIITIGNNLRELSSDLQIVDGRSCP